MYHQLTEIIFKMILSETQQIANTEDLSVNVFIDKLGRVNRYFDMLTSSFAIMKDGMDTAQYMQFRTSLTPASGFQSAQYRMIEISCTDLDNLIDVRFRKSTSKEASVEEKIQNIYWQAAGKDHKTGAKSLTLQLFEEKYLDSFHKLAEAYKTKNIRAKFDSFSEAEKTDEKLIAAMRKLDVKVNVVWPMVHFKTAEKYLDSGEETTEATGGSDWKKYMHPKYQRRIFFPNLWSQEELDNWGC